LLAAKVKKKQASSIFDKNEEYGLFENNLKLKVIPIWKWCLMKEYEYN
jgi:hypothetical protein